MAVHLLAAFRAPADPTGTTPCTNIRLMLLKNDQLPQDGGLELQWTTMLHSGHRVNFPITIAIPLQQHDIAVLRLDQASTEMIRQTGRFRVPFQPQLHGHNKPHHVQGCSFLKSTSPAIVRVESMKAFLSTYWCGVPLAELKEQVKAGCSGTGLMVKHPQPVDKNWKKLLLVGVVSWSGKVNNVDQSIVILVPAFTAMLEDANKTQAAASSNPLWLEVSNPNCSNA